MTTSTLPIRRCNAFDATGRRRCGTIGACTHVRTIDVDWTWMPLPLLGLIDSLIFAGDDGVTVLQDRWVCMMCRRRMKLPDHDVDFIADLVSITDHIVEPAAERGEFVLP